MGRQATAKIRSQLVLDPVTNRQALAVSKSLKQQAQEVTARKQAAGRALELAQEVDPEIQAMLSVVHEAENLAAGQIERHREARQRLDEVMEGEARREAREDEHEAARIAMATNAEAPESQC